MTEVDRTVPLSGPSVPWFADPTLSRVFSGHQYAHRCVAAIGPPDFSRVAFVTTSNPRQKATVLGKQSDSAFIVHECAWSLVRTSNKVHAEVEALLTKANVPRVDGFVTIPSTHIRPLLSRAAKNAGVVILWHSGFHAMSLGIETEKVRAQLKAQGIDPSWIAATRVV